MLVLSEKAFFRGGMLEIELHDDLSYRLRFGDLIEYRDGRKTIRGKVSAYEFRSVEQLRYDFERDVKSAGGAVGEGP
jgi:hypothetical protein